MTGILGDRLLENADPSPLDDATSTTIRSHLSAAGFEAQDVGSHITISFTEAPLAPVEFAVIHLDEDGKVLWIKALAQRWWELFLIGDRNGRFAQFWQAIETLPALPYPIEQGTIGDLPPKLRKLLQTRFDNT